MPVRPKSLLLTDDRGVSSVIGVILMVAIVVILGAVIGTFAFDTMFNTDIFQSAINELTDGDLDGKYVGSSIIVGIATSRVSWKSF